MMAMMAPMMSKRPVVSTLKMPPVSMSSVVLGVVTLITVVTIGVMTMMVIIRVVLWLIVHGGRLILVMTVMAVVAVVIPEVMVMCHSGRSKSSWNGERHESG